MILDTDFLIDLLKGESSAVVQAQELERSNESIKATACSAFDMFSAAMSLPVHKRALVMELLESMTLLPLDTECARRAATVQAEAQAREQQLDREDALIAGFALHHNERVLTRNPSLLALSGLKTQRY